MKANALVMAVGLAVAALGSVGAANATPMLQIVANAAGDPALAANQEAIGDNGGTHYPSAPNPSPVAGAGLPTDLGGWPNNYPSPGTYPPGFALDTFLPPGAGNYGISGWDGSYLNLSQAGNVTFQFMGKGDAIDRNVFQVWDFGTSVWKTIFDTQGSHGTCGASGSTPSIDCSPTGSSVTQFFNAGLIPFQFVNQTSGVAAINDGSNNNSPDKNGLAGYFLGIDPYLASGAFQNEGSAAYAGFTDRGCVPGGACDHDYEDLVVRASVPEPGTVFLLGIGMMGVASSLRRRKV